MTVFLDVNCTCGFQVIDLSSYEAAADVVAWHTGKELALGSGTTPYIPFPCRGTASITEAESR